MSDKALENALRQRDAIAAQINQAQQQIEEWQRSAAEIDAFVAAWHKFADAAIAVGTKAPVVVFPIRNDIPLPAPSPRKRMATHNSTKEEVARVTRELIEVHGAPIQRTVLLNLLRERGLVIEGTEPETVLSTMLWRMSKEGAPIVHLKAIGYWDSEKDWPEARHFPSLAKKLETEGAFSGLNEDSRDPDLMRDAVIERAAEAKEEAIEALRASAFDRPFDK
ncbi:hypothetical protein QO058_22690 [Bosea vestrisii]|uniref:hypothetical protein n=1 Tax=Bosea vestrisii TaxID=151416 RepID=UPI0024E01086|nr:hypothetical protein [Bosea vestrisii]WID95541.1 hypothetical protein QO058_22690 [Bosea vestrisii]